MSAETILRVVAWPVVALILFAGTLVYLLPVVKRPLGRLTKAKWKDAELSTEQTLTVQTAVEITSTASGVTNPGSAVIPYPFEAGDNSYLSEEAERVRQYATGVRFNNPEERGRWMWREGARLRIALDFERIHHWVFASQMEALGRANRPQGLLVTELRAQYEAMAAAAPQQYSTFSYDAWRGFLENNGLLMQSGDKVFTTDKGSNVRQYLVAMR